MQDAFPMEFRRIAPEQRCPRKLRMVFEGNDFIFVPCEHFFIDFIKEPVFALSP